MATKPDNTYGSFGSVPDSISDSGSGAQSMTERATPGDFGGQVGQALEQSGQGDEKLGSEASNLAGQYAEEATRAKVDDTYANQYAPAAAQLRQNFDQLQGIDKVQGYHDYINNLQQTREDMLSNTESPYEKQLLSAQINRHVTNEIDGASRELGPALAQYSNAAQADKIKAESDYAVNNYNNPDVVKQSMDAIDGSIMLRGIDSGLPPDSPVIEQQQREAKGTLAAGMVGRALMSGDINTAQMIYANNSVNIPGYQQLEIEKTLHSESIRQTGVQSSDALLAGKPLPPAVGYHPPEVQAAIANSAQSTGVDPNAALTVARIESNYGQNVGSRGDIGQTGKPGDLPTQAKNLCDALKQANDTYEKQFGVKAEPWQAYAIYQQGAGGGPALMMAATSNPTAKAVDVLRGLYDNPKSALQAVVNNGGNASMTSGQFLDLIKQKYNDNAQRAACDFPQPAAVQNPNGEGADITTSTPPNLGAAIMAPHQTNGIPVQPAATPVQALTNFDQSYPDALMRANQIPNVAQREGVIKALEQKRAVYVAGATAWKQQFLSKAGALAADPGFTSTDQIPPDMRASLVDNPHTLNYLEQSAQENLNRSTGATTKDQKEYGTNFYKAFTAIHAPADAPNRITDITQLQGMVGQQGGLTIAGYDKLKSELSAKGTPDGDAEAKMRDQTFKVVKSIVSGADDGMGIKDPKGEEIFAHAQPLVYKAIDEGKAKGIPPSELYNPESPNWVGNVARGLKRTQQQQVADMMKDNGTVGATPVVGAATPRARTLTDIFADINNGKLKRDQGRAEAESHGLVTPKPKPPQVPLAQ